MEMVDLKVTDKLARRENAKHEMQARTFCVPENAGPKIARIRKTVLA